MPLMRDLKWSQSEKAIARKAYKQALERELAVMIRKTKQMAGAMETPSQLWALHDYLTKARAAVGEKYDYRYSVLPLVLAKLILDGYLRREELDGLGEDKLRYINTYVGLPVVTPSQQDQMGSREVLD